LIECLLDGDIAKIVDEMQVVVGRIVDECAENSPSAKINNIPVMSYNSMVPTRDNDYCKDLIYDNSSQANVSKNVFIIIIYYQIINILFVTIIYILELFVRTARENIRTRKSS